MWRTLLITAGSGSGPAQCALLLAADHKPQAAKQTLDIYLFN
jgi:hypothetical protein